MEMIVADATPLIHLTKVGKLTLLRQTFKKILVPRAVFKEVVERGEEKGHPDAKIIRRATEEWIKVKELTDVQIREVSDLLKIAPIGRGEGEGIILARDMKCPLLIDEKIGQNIAKSYGIKTYWTTSIILKAWKEKIIKKKEAKTIIEDLIHSGLKIRPEVALELMKLLS